MKKLRKDKLIGMCLANILQFMTNKVVQIENIIDNIKIKLTNRYIIKPPDYKWNKYYLFSGSTEHFKNMDHVLGHKKNNNMYMIPVCSKAYSTSISLYSSHYVTWNKKITKV